MINRNYPTNEDKQLAYCLEKNLFIQANKEKIDKMNPSQLLEAIFQLQELADHEGYSRGYDTGERHSIRGTYQGEHISYFPKGEGCD